jgi:adenylate kinase
MSSNTATSTTVTTRLSRLLVMGPPGSGKRTQSGTLAQRLELANLSTGALFRSVMTYDTPVAARVRDAVGHGGYVDDATTNAAFDQEFDAQRFRAGFLLFGYPRTTAQAEHLDRLLAEQQTGLDAVLCLRVADDELIERLLARGEELHRIDDQAETIRPRLALYRERTEPLVELYRGRGLLVEVDGSGSVQQVADRIDAALQRYITSAAGAGA